MDLKIIITGATGMVGEGVLLTCLEHPDVKEILMVNRKHFDLEHPKLKELIVPDFLNLDASIQELSGYNACFYCAGISSVGMNEEKYTHITYYTTLHFAKKLAEVNTDMVFTFVSGSHTDSSEKGKIMWARVKGKTENALAAIGFKSQYNFRPGGMEHFPGQKNAKTLYKVLVAFFSLFIPKQICSLEELGMAMIHSVERGYPKNIIEIADIKILSKVTDDV